MRRLLLITNIISLVIFAYLTSISSESTSVSAVKKLSVATNPVVQEVSTTLAPLSTTTTQKPKRTSSTTHPFVLRTTTTSEEKVSYDDGNGFCIISGSGEAPSSTIPCGQTPQTPVYYRGPDGKCGITGKGELINDGLTEDPSCATPDSQAN